MASTLNWNALPSYAKRRKRQGFKAFFPLGPWEGKTQVTDPSVSAPAVEEPSGAGQVAPELVKA